MLLWFVIVVYILSVVASLIFLFAVGGNGQSWFKILAAIHLLLAVVFIFNLSANKQEAPHYLSFLLFICTGVIGCGLAYGTRTTLLFKIYFSIFALTFVVFLLSPSSLFRFLVTASFKSSNETPLLVTENLYLERQSEAFSNEDKILYKLTEKHGLFHRSISRDLNFNGKLDSVKLLTFVPHQSVSVRGYAIKKTFVADERDSVDLTLDLNPKRKDVIERKL